MKEIGPSTKFTLRVTADRNAEIFMGVKPGEWGPGKGFVDVKYPDGST